MGMNNELKKVIELIEGTDGKASERKREGNSENKRGDSRIRKENRNYEIFYFCGCFGEGEKERGK